MASISTSLHSSSEQVAGNGDWSGDRHVENLNPNYSSIHSALVLAAAPAEEGQLLRLIQSSDVNRGSKSFVDDLRGASSARGFASCRGMGCTPRSAARQSTANGPLRAPHSVPQQGLQCGPRSTVFSQAGGLAVLVAWQGWPEEGRALLHAAGKSRLHLRRRGLQWAFMRGARELCAMIMRRGATREYSS
jgi:hypothetical protein